MSPLTGTDKPLATPRRIWGRPLVEIHAVRTRRDPECLSPAHQVAGGSPRHRAPTVRKPPVAGAVPDTESEGLVSAPTSLVLASRSSPGLGPGWRPGPPRGTVRSPSSPMMLISLRRMPPKPRLLVPPIGEFTVEPCSDMTEAANDREHAVFLIADLDNSTDRRGHREGEASQPHLLHEDPIGSVGSGFAPPNPGPGHEPKPYVRTFPTPMEERRPLPRGVVKGRRHRPARRQAAGTLRLGYG